MTPHNGLSSQASQSNGRKRPSQGRVVPAIPLALSKPKPSKAQPRAQPKAETDVKGGAAPGTPQDEAESGSMSGQPTETTRQAEASVDAPTTAAYINGTSTPTENGIKPASVDTPVSRGSAAMSMSHGETPEPSVADGPAVSTPPSTSASNQAQQLVSSPSSARKLSDKHDMRLRTELPPAFVPSTASYTPQSATTFARTNGTQQLPSRHHPSTSSIVFGGHDSDSSSPAAPASAGSGIQAPVQWPQPGAQRQPQPAPASSHTHHVSEPFLQRAYDQSYPPLGAWNSRQSQQAPMHGQPQFQHPAHSHFRYPPREIFTPAEDKANGFYNRSRSGSHASSGAFKVPEDLQSPTANGGPMDPLKPFMPGPPNLRHHHPQQSAPPSQYPHPEVAARFENAEALRHHVQTQFMNPLLADCRLQVVEEETGRQQDLDAHKIILARSSKLLDLIQNSERPADASSKTQVLVRLNGSYVRLRPMMESIQYIYGGSLSVLNQHRHSQGTAEAFAANEERMGSALQLVATASWLKLTVVAARAMDAIFMLLHWHTIPSVLAFALEGGLSPVWNVDDGSELSCSSSDDSLGRPDAAGSPNHDPYATDLLHRIIDFTVHMFPPNFYLDASAPQLASCPRLPAAAPTHESRPSRSDPRLSQIRFGEVPAEEHNRPSPVTTTISSVLLSLPFALLKCILEHTDLVYQLGADTVASIMRQVVAERELRRKKALQARSASHSEDGVESTLFANLYYEEEVEPSAHHRAGFRLARRKRGIDTPPSSGAASERQS